jgi:hypothetical protein
MKAWVAALIDLLRALASRLAAALLRGARIVAHHAAANARVVSAGAAALAAGGYPRAKAAIFALPRKLGHVLKEKLIEIAVTLAVIAGVAYYFSDAEVIRREPLACWLSDKTHEIFASHAQRKPGDPVRVLVAQVLADGSGHLTSNVTLSFTGMKGIEVRELCHSLGVIKGEAAAEGWQRAEETARQLLADWDAQIILWGKAASNDFVQLHITTAASSTPLRVYEISEKT